MKNALLVMVIAAIIGCVRSGNQHQEPVQEEIKPLHNDSETNILSDKTKKNIESRALGDTTVEFLRELIEVKDGEKVYELGELPLGDYSVQESKLYFAFINKDNNVEPYVLSESRSDMASPEAEFNGGYTTPGMTTAGGQRKGQFEGLGDFEISTSDLVQKSSHSASFIAKYSTSEDPVKLASELVDGSMSHSLDGIKKKKDAKFYNNKRETHLIGPTVMADKAPVRLIEKTFGVTAANEGVYTISVKILSYEKTGP